MQNVSQPLSCVREDVVRYYQDGEWSDYYLCVSAVQYKNATDYHRDLELAVTKRDHDERDLKLAIWASFLGVK